MNKIDKWLTPKDLQHMMGVSRSTAYRMIRYLPQTRIGSNVRVSYAAVLKALHDNGGELYTSDRQAEDGRDGF